MAEQLSLAGDPLQPHFNGKPLTPRQQLAFDYIRERDGVTADEVGAWLHANRDTPKHADGDRCAYCWKDGRSVLTSRALAPLVTYRRANRALLYIARDPADRVTESGGGLIATSDPDPATNPWADL